MDRNKMSIDEGYERYCLRKKINTFWFPSFHLSCLHKKKNTLWFPSFHLIAFLFISLHSFLFHSDTFIFFMFNCSSSQTSGLSEMIEWLKVSLVFKVPQFFYFFCMNKTTEKCLVAFPFPVVLIPSRPGIPYYISFI